MSVEQKDAKTAKVIQNGERNMPAQTDREALRILVVVAHPHDFTHCAGTCGIHVAMGDTVTVVTMTDGGRTHNERYLDELVKPQAERDPRIVNQSRDEYAAGKAQELRDVCAILGVTDLRILTMPEPFRLHRSPQAIDAIRDIITQVRPDVMITHAPYNTSPVGISTHGRATALLNDHRECAIATMEAKLTGAETPDYQGKRVPHRVATTFFLGIDVPFDDIDVFVDISDWEDHRFRAESLFRSQGQTEAFARRRVEIGAGSLGWWAKTQYAEGFVRAEPETLSCLDVTAWAKRNATASRIDQLRYRGGETKLKVEEDLS